MTIRQATLILQAMPVGRKAHNERTQEWEKRLLGNSCGGLPARMLLCLLLARATMLLSSRGKPPGSALLRSTSSNVELFLFKGNFPLPSYRVMSPRRWNTFRGAWRPAQAPASVTPTSSSQNISGPSIRICSRPI